MFARGSATRSRRRVSWRRMGRPPSGLELSSEVARLSRNPTTACAGFDVTFTPVKSVSALWAVAPQAMAAQIEEAHNAAVADALRYLEERVLYSRRGAGGVRQVEVTGLVAAAFTHRDSRAGDPNLHTHVAIANKVQTLDGHWLASTAARCSSGHGERLGGVQHAAGGPPHCPSRSAVRSRSDP